MPRSHLPVLLPANVHTMEKIGKNREMRTRTTLAVGFVFGYYFGAKAGRKRYEQIHHILGTTPCSRMTSKAQALARLAMERLRTDHDEDNVVSLSSITSES